MHLFASSFRFVGATSVCTAAAETECQERPPSASHAHICLHPDHQHVSMPTPPDTHSRERTGHVNGISSHCDGKNARYGPQLLRPAFRRSSINVKTRGCDSSALSHSPLRRLSGSRSGASGPSSARMTTSSGTCMSDMLSHVARGAGSPRQLRSRQDSLLGMQPAGWCCKMCSPTLRRGVPCLCARATTTCAQWQEGCCVSGL
jgi:hypothetical protein